MGDAYACAAKVGDCNLPTNVAASVGKLFVLGKQDTGEWTVLLAKVSVRYT